MAITSSRQAVLTGFSAAYAAIAPTWNQTTRIAWPEQPLTPPNTPYLDVRLVQAGGFNNAVTRFDQKPAVLDVHLFSPGGQLDDEALYLIVDDVNQAFIDMTVDPTTSKGDISTDDFGNDSRGYKQVRCRLALEFEG